VTWRQALAPLADRRFRWFFASQAADTWGATMAPVALAFAVLTIEDSATALGQVLAARSIPMVLLLLLGGVIADRFGRRLVIQLSHGLSALSQGVAAALVVTGHAELWQLVVLQAINGAADAASFPAMQGMIPQVVARAQLQSANALLSMTRGTMFAIGPTTASLLVVMAGPGWALAATAATWLAALLLLVPVHVPRRAAGPASLLQDLREGWTLFRTTPWLWIVVVAFAVINAIIAGAWNTLGPPVAQDTIGVTGWGYVVSAQAVGLVVASLVLLRLSVRRPLLTGMLGCLVGPVPMVMLGLDPQLVPLLVATFLTGVGLEVFGLGWSLAMQENIPDEMLSRAYSYDALGSFVAVPVGQLAFGPLGERFGLQPVLVAGGIVYAAVCLLTLASRSVRTLERVPVSGRTTSAPVPGSP